MREIKLGFCDFWSGFDPTTDNIFGEVLKKYFNIIYDNNEPDFLIFSVYGSNHRKYKNCVKIMFCPENFYSHKYDPFDGILGEENLFKHADYVISGFDVNSPKNYRMPCYIRRHGFNIKEIIEDRSIPKKTKKVLFLQQNCVPFRDNFVKKLQRYIEVDCLGNCLRNKNTHVGDKIEFMKDYKFVMGFENSSHPGYSSEKLIDGFISKTIPLYWGDTNANIDYDKNSFLNLHDFDNEDQFIQKILEVDNDDNLFRSMLEIQPILNTDLYNEDKFINFIKKIFND
jgi:hypothetical protein